METYLAVKDKHINNRIGQPIIFMLKIKAPTLFIWVLNYLIKTGKIDIEHGIAEERDRVKLNDEFYKDGL